MSIGFYVINQFFNRAKKLNCPFIIQFLMCSEKEAITEAQRRNDPDHPTHFPYLKVTFMNLKHNHDAAGRFIGD